jgi:hypothetical protein
LGFFEGFKGKSKKKKKSRKKSELNETFDIEKYMVVISSVQLCGHIMGHAIYTIKTVNCLSFDAHPAVLNDKVKENSHYSKTYCFF